LGQNKRTYFITYGLAGLFGQTLQKGILPDTEKAKPASKTRLAEKVESCVQLFRSGAHLDRWPFCFSIF